MVFRSDNRSPDQIRPVSIVRDFIRTAEGSVLIEVGNTRVICTASVEEAVPAFLRNTGKGWVSSEYGMLPRATLTRTPREVSKGRASGRTHEIQRLIGRSLRAVTDLKKLGERSVLVDCDVLQADGGTRTAAITGAYVALALALRTAFDPSSPESWPLTGAVAATSVGVVEGVALLDLAYDEDSRAEVDMNVAMTDAGSFVEVQGTAEGRAFSREELDSLLGLAQSGIARLLEVQQLTLGEQGFPVTARV